MGLAFYLPSEHMQRSSFIIKIDILMLILTWVSPETVDVKYFKSMQKKCYLLVPDEFLIL